MKYLWIFLTITFFIHACRFWPVSPPKSEFRAAWIATVANIDWPESPFDSVRKQKRDLIHLLDVLKEAGINALILQVRPECDALYHSRYEPWSYWLTGRQGQAPQPYYDPLQFAIEQAHQRGMELHAWFNPFRAQRIWGNYPLSQQHVVLRKPAWILRFGSNEKPLCILNPGIPAVRQYIVDVIMDVVTRYDVDGVHFDDYFYPYPPNDISKINNDSLTYRLFKHGDNSDVSIDSWRRENVNRLIKAVYDSIQVVKPWVRFGISPFGIYRDGQPPGIAGMDAYRKIYCDPLNWLQNKTVDYLTPQLYWKIGGKQDYKKLLNWWAEQAARNGRHLYPGHIFGRRFSADELPAQLRYARENKYVQGDVYFSAKHFLLNTFNFFQKLKTNYYRYPALIPSMAWKTQNRPLAPRDFKFAANKNSVAFFQWKRPYGTGSDSCQRFVLYRFLQRPTGLFAPREPQYIFKVVGDSFFLPPPAQHTLPQLYFTVTAVNRNGRESVMSTPIKIIPPDKVQLLFPDNGYEHMALKMAIRWKLLKNAASYRLQIAEDSSFKHIVVDETGLKQNFFAAPNLHGQRKYYWRVAAQNPAGTGDFSDVRFFFTAFPLPPVLESPEDEESVESNVRLKWYKSKKADSYHVQLVRLNRFGNSIVQMDTTVTDTLVNVAHLKYSKDAIYAWRVKALNRYGESAWSQRFIFHVKTKGSLPAGPFDPQNWTGRTEQTEIFQQS